MRSNDTPVKNSEIFGWAMFDFANSSYTTVILTAVYAPFFVKYIVPEDSPMRNTWWSLALGVATFLVILLAPFVGAICDFSGHKKRYLIGSALVAMIGTAFLATVGPGQVVWGACLIAISYAAFMLSEALTGSFLPDLATPRNMARISGLGWGLGYFGGLASLAIVAALLQGTDAQANPAQFVSRNQLAVLATALFFFIAAIPTMLLVKNRSRPAPGFENASLGRLFRAGLHELVHTARAAKGQSQLFRFLVAFMIYIAGLDIIIKYVGIYVQSTFGFTMREMVIMFLVIQVSAAAGSLAFGFVEAWLGSKRTVLVTLVWWIAAVFAIYFMEDMARALGFPVEHVFYGICLAAGAAMGALQSSSRAIVGLLTPPHKEAQMFGFWGMFGRLGSVLGIAFGPAADLFGLRTAMLMVIGFFVVGGLLVLRVQLPAPSHD